MYVILKEGEVDLVSDARKGGENDATLDWPLLRIKERGGYSTLLWNINEITRAGFDVQLLAIKY